MTIKEFYEQVHANYDDMLTRVPNDALMTKIAKMFLNDQSFKQLKEGLETGDGDKAFNGAHSLKGVCLNLGFTQLSSDVSEITELLRGRQVVECSELFHRIEENYNYTIQKLEEVD